jgi:hypothetical protein
MRIAWDGGLVSIGPGLKRQTRLNLAFYIGVPCLCGFLFGWMGAGQVTDWPKPAAIAVWTVVSLVGWFAADAGTRVAAAAVRPLGWPLWAALGLGVVASGVIAVPLNYTVGELFLMAGYPTRGLAALADYSLSRAAEGIVAPLLIWTSVNYLFFRYADWPRYGYRPVAAPAPSAAPSASTPCFLLRVRPALRGRVLALQAELHYLRVFTEHGDDLILYKFGDAVAEMAGTPGAQVHRSWWVAADAVIGRRAGARPVLRLSNGLEVPISRSGSSAACRLTSFRLR